MSKTTAEIAELITIEVAKICGCNWESCTSVRNATTDAINRALQNYGQERREQTLRELLEVADHDEPDLVKGYIQGELGMTTPIEEVRARLRRKVN